MYGPPPIGARVEDAVAVILTGGEPGVEDAVAVILTGGEPGAAWLSPLVFVPTSLSFRLISATVMATETAAVAKSPTTIRRIARWLVDFDGTT